MTSRWGLLAVLGVITLLIAATNLRSWAWGHLSHLVRPVQEGLAPQGGPAAAAELAALREEVIRLNAENVILRTRLSEYLSIRGEGGVPPAEVVVVRGRIIARTQRQGRRFCELDVGAIDGVSKGLPACSGWSLLGVVVGVQEGRCLVQEVSDAQSRIPAAIVDAHQKVAEGVLAGGGSAHALRMDYVEVQEGVEIGPGMQVVTAGGDGRLPAGLVLGTVTTAVRGGVGEHWQIGVEPVRTTDNLESLVLIRFAEQSPLPP